MIGALSDIAHKTGGLPGNFFLFGTGDLEKNLFHEFRDSPLLEDCSCLNPEEIEEKMEFLGTSEEEELQKIYFFGWQSQATIRSVLEVSHFALMPSRFLESFGLSALESLSGGVPVIGFQKGGLVPFIQEGLTLPFSLNDRENREALAQRILEVSERYTSFVSLTESGESEWDSLSHESRRIADGYTEGRWLRHVREYVPKDTKKIFLASDYTTSLGGIESHVQTIARTLRQHGYEVEIFGWNVPKGNIGKLLRLLGLVYSLFNISALWKMRRKIREFRPDVIWIHSVSRFLGPLVVREVTKSSIFSLVTYHDLGLLSPFPSEVESEDMIPKTPGLREFLSSTNSRNPIAYAAVVCKYFQVYFLRKFLRGIDLHVVPSGFLAPHIHNIIEVSDEKIVVLEHFL